MLGVERVVWIRPWRGPGGAPTNLSNSTAATTTTDFTFTVGDAEAQTEFWASGSVLTTLPTSRATYQHTGLTANSSATYTARHLRNGQYSSFDTAVTGWTAPSVPPAIVTTTGALEVKVSWTTAHVLPIAVYRDGGYLLTASTSSSYITDSGVSSGVAYGYRVAHVGSVWTGATTSTSTATVS